jgi:hypothetical protein
VVINEERLSDDLVRDLEEFLGLRILDDDYWYDYYSGAFGVDGGPTAGFILPDLDLGGPLRADASAGDTGVFVNGRELHRLDVAGLELLVGVVLPGRYWVDSEGYFGFEFGPAIGNLIFIVQASGGGGAYTESTYGGYIGSDGQTSYYFDPSSGCTVMSGAGLSC